MRPLHVVLATMAGGALFLAPSPISDVDAPWHVQVGRSIRAGQGLDGADTSWLGVDVGEWRTSQWLAEVAMSLTVDAVGWAGLTVGRVVLAAAVLAVLALTLPVRRRPDVAALVGVPLLLVLGTSVQERPGSASFVFLPLLGWACLRLWRDGQRPPLPVVAACCLVWAQLHGLWVLAPAAFGLVALGALLDGARPGSPRLRAPLLALAASLAGLLNPLGPGSLLLPWSMRSATGQIIMEWRPTALSSPWVWCAAAFAAVLLAALLRSPQRVSRAEVLFCLSWLGFALLAYRNITPAVLVLAPACAAAVERAWPRRPLPPRGRREGALLTGLAGAVLAGSLVTAVVTQVRTDPLTALPGVGIARVLAERPDELRVWNDYNTSGSLIAFGGGRLRLRIDGRADLWGSEGIARQVGVQRLDTGWEEELRRFDPDVVVLAADAPLTTLLVREGTWRVTAQDRGLVLMEPTGRSPR